MDNYLVLIGDIISSREVERRQELQTTLEGAFQILNELRIPDTGANQASQKTLLSPYTLTLGDEFQALYQAADHVLRDSLFILESAHPHRIRFSYGVGAIETEINTQQAIGMDGTAFHEARDGIEELKGEKGDYLFSLRGISDDLNLQLSNHALRLFSNLLQGWQKNRLMVLRRQLDGISARGIADELGISKTAVYRNIYAGNLREIEDILKTITAGINRDMGGV